MIEPIETAPRDGSPVRLIAPLGGRLPELVLGFWCGRHHGWMLCCDRLGRTLHPRYWLAGNEP